MLAFQLSEFRDLHIEETIPTCLLFEFATNGDFHEKSFVRNPIIELSNTFFYSGGLNWTGENQRRNLFKFCFLLGRKCEINDRLG